GAGDGGRIRGEAVAAAANGEQHARSIGVVVQLLAQTGDVHVDGPRGHVARVHAPDVGENLVTRDHAAAVYGQIAQQLDFLLRELRPLPAVQANFAGPQVGDAAGETNLADVEWALRRAAQDGFDTGQQLAHAERLDHIIVGAEPETADPIALRAARRQDDDRQR